MSDNAKKVIKRSKNNIMYIGDKRRDEINSHAVSITTQTGIPVQPGDFLQYLIDNYAQDAQEDMIRAIIKE